MRITLHDLNKSTAKVFTEYVDIARKTDLKEFEGEQIEINNFYKETLERLDAEIYRNVKCILAMIEDKVVGRIEYHYYGAFMDGYKMAYISYIYVLKEYRGNGIAKKLFSEAEIRMKKDGINQYYLICSDNEETSRFYEKFSNVQVHNNKVLRKNINLYQF